MLGVRITAKELGQHIGWVVESMNLSRRELLIRHSVLDPEVLDLNVPGLPAEPASICNAERCGGIAVHYRLQLDIEVRCNAKYGRGLLSLLAHRI